jgi:hypothetical protein
MSTHLIIAAIAAAIYIYAAIAYYYGFKYWYPLCACKGMECRSRRPMEARTLRVLFLDIQLTSPVPLYLYLLVMRRKGFVALVELRFPGIP